MEKIPGIFPGTWFWGYGYGKTPVGYADRNLPHEDVLTDMEVTHG